ncbi:alpha/beta hydrolase [Sphingomonas sp. Y38-1Y]|uniref:alpha/beta hydrolase n=1 Tax=Sphingomonas sp. Y38-1Y TaxID=3078265 RepID=UPI0028F0094A|nr:alpha/beta hydrolase [Sphingomonas sp. Y38-1Y]
MRDGATLLGDLPALRRSMAEQGRALPAPELEAADHDADGVPVRLYRPAGAAGQLPLLVFLHGGGWILGDLDTHDACCRWLSERAGCAVLAVGYRLAPEHRFPAGLDDVGTAWRWASARAAALGCDPARVAIGGESAGANLAAALTLRLREAGEAQPRFQLLVHPPTDLTLSQPSIDAVELPGLSRAFLAECVGAYLGDVSAEHPHVSPLHAADLSALAPAVVVTVELDPLRDDGEFYALALTRAGNEVSVQRLPALPHGFMFLPASEPRVAAAYDLLGARIALYFDRP